MQRGAAKRLPFRCHNHPVRDRFYFHSISLQGILDLVGGFNAHNMAPIIEEIVEMRQEILSQDTLNVRVQPAQPGEVLHQDRKIMRSEEHTSELQSLRHL